MPKPKTGRSQEVPFSMRMRAAEKRYLLEGAKAQSKDAPSATGLGPFMLWAAKRETHRLLGMTLDEFEATSGKTKKGPGR